MVADAIDREPVAERLPDVAALLRTSSRGPRSGPRHLHINLHWLIQLRWVAVVGQASITLSTAFLLGVELPLAEILGAIAFLAATNAGAALIARGVEDVRAWWLELILALDVLLLSGLLSMTGGPHNPFSLFYLVHVALAAVLLGARATWVIAVLSVGSYFALFHVSAEDAAIRAQIQRYDEEGLLVALGIASLVLGYFIHRIRHALEEREDELAAVRVQQARDEKLTSLATLAAGAAHELATPLATIAVAAKEMDRALATTGGSLAEDARLIREQVDRCRVILHQMAARAGEASGEIAEPVTVRRLLDETLSSLVQRPRIAVDVPAETLESEWRVPLQALAHAFRGIVKNALDASPDGQAVTIVGRHSPKGLELVVTDRGHGMPREVVERAGEPFFTTKEPGRGMGLGLFLTRSVLERLGGRMTIDSRPNEGTSVVLSLPGDLMTQSGGT